MINLFLTLALSAPVNQVCTSLNSTLFVEDSKITIFELNSKNPSQYVMATDCNRLGTNLDCVAHSGVGLATTKLTKLAGRFFNLTQNFVQGYRETRTIRGFGPKRFRCKTVDASELEAARLEAHLELTRLELDHHALAEKKRQRQIAIDRIRKRVYPAVATALMTREERREADREFKRQVSELGL